MTYIVRIDGRLPGANEYIEACRRNKYEAAKMKREAEELIGWYIMNLPPLKNPVHITFGWAEPNARRDYDNISFGKKFILDAMQKYGKLMNDNRKTVVGFADEFSVDPQNPHITLTIKEIGK